MTDGALQFAVRWAYK
jgi:hypothetical protein